MGCRGDVEGETGTEGGGKVENGESKVVSV